MRGEGSGGSRTDAVCAAGGLARAGDTAAPSATTSAAAAPNTFELMTVTPRFVRAAGNRRSGPRAIRPQQTVVIPRAAKPIRGAQAELDWPENWERPFESAWVPRIAVSGDRGMTGLFC